MAPRRGSRHTSVNPSRKDEAENQRNDRAWLAVKAFNELKPTLTSFARAVTGRSDVQVRAAKMTCTNGKYIDIVPPIALGDRMEHDKSLCDRRDRETLMKMCQACATRELLMGRLFHEIAHIAFDSFSPVLKFDRDKMHALVDEWHPKDACNHAPALHSQVDSLRTHNELTSAFSPFLYFLLVAYDDARVDAKMYRARPGLKVPTEARLRVVFTRGIEKADGSLVKWSESALNAQVTIGLRMLGSGLDLRPGYLSDDALKALEDPELIRISDRAHLANSISNSFDIALAAFRRLQEMGLCYVPKCVPTPPSLNAEPDDKDEKDEDDSDSGNQGGTGNSSGDPESKDSEAPENDPDPGDDDSGASDNSGDGGSSSAGDDDRQDAGDESSKDDSDGDADFENEDSRGDSQDQEGKPGNDESDDREVRDDDDGSECSEQSGSEGADDPADRHDDGDGGDSPEPEPGDQGEEPGGVGEGDDEDPAGSDDADPSGSGDDGAGEPDDDGSDREPGADAQGTGAGGADPGSDNRDDSEAPSEQDVEEAGRSDDDGDGESYGDIEPSDSPLESPEGDGDDAEAPAGPLGEDVWDEDNPETEVVPPENQGTPEDVGELLEKFLGHGREDEVDAELLGEPIPDEQLAEMEKIAVTTAVGQEAVFDTSSRTVRGVQVVQYPHAPFGWGGERQSYYDYKPADFMLSETIIGRALMQARIVFSENKRAKVQGNLKSGRINTRVLGRRAALGDDRLFKKKTLPGKRDYFVVITADCSGSTQSSHRNERIKRAVFAKAELLNRLGIPFAIYGHTGGEGDLNVGWWSDHPDADGMTEVWMMQIKGADEPWNDTTKQRLADMPPVAENLDGHTLEFCRKVAMKSQATDRIIIYYTDGAMPAANYDEERVILESEIEKCKREKITLMAVGINTDSPERYGFDTVRVDSDEDLGLVVDRLKARLTN